IEDASVIASMSGHSNAINRLAIRNQGDYLVSGGLDGDLILWDTASHQLIGRYTTGTGIDISHLAFSADGLQIISNYADGALIIWNVDVSTWQNQACARIRTDNREELCQ